MEYELTRFEAETDIESYIEEYVDVETFLECCKSCPNYGNVWSCPPFDFDPIEYWRSFSKLKVAGYRGDYPADRTEEAMTQDSKGCRKTASFCWSCPRTFRHQRVASSCRRSRP